MTDLPEKSCFGPSLEVPTWSTEVFTFQGG